LGRFSFPPPLIHFLSSVLHLCPACLELFLLFRGQNREHFAAHLRSQNRFVCHGRRDGAAPRADCRFVNRLGLNRFSERAVRVPHLGRGLLELFLVRFPDGPHLFALRIGEVDAAQAEVAQGSTWTDTSAGAVMRPATSSKRARPLWRLGKGDGGSTRERGDETDSNKNTFRHYVPPQEALAMILTDPGAEG
jgi:hypothetical protein